MYHVVLCSSSNSLFSILTRVQGGSADPEVDDCSGMEVALAKGQSPLTMAWTACITCSISDELVFSTSAEMTNRSLIPILHCVFFSASPKDQVNELVKMNGMGVPLSSLAMMM